MLAFLLNGTDDDCIRFAFNRDREEPRDSPPPTPPGIRITYQGGSVDYSGLCETSRVFS
jgi:hypothetical protein